MATQFTCEECSQSFSGSEETYCKVCFQRLEDEIESLKGDCVFLNDELKKHEEENEELKKDIICIESEIEDLNNTIIAYEEKLGIS